MWVARGCVKRGGCIRVFKVQLAIGLGNLNKKISLGVCVRVCVAILARATASLIVWRPTKGSLVLFLFSVCSAVDELE